MRCKELVTILMLVACSTTYAATLDSLRLEEKDGKQFIIHKVEAKETLFGISRRYGVTVDQLKQANPELGGLAIDQLLSIPYPTRTAASPKPDAHSQFHIVAAGDTFYSISRLYNTSVDSLMQMNKLSSTALSLGDTLVVGYKNTPEKLPPAPALADNTNDVQETLPNNAASGNETIHSVAASETLYSIARKYEVTTDQLKKWNKLQSNALSIGQELVINKTKKKGQTKDTTSTPTLVEIPEQEEAIDDVEEVVEEEKKPIDTLYVSTDNSRFKERVEKVGSLNKTIEEGFAMKIHRSDGTRKYLALHRTARIGTLIEVKNQMNNQSIFARVVGKLPETGINRNVLIRLSDAAYKKLKALDARVPVEIGYVKDNE